MSLLSNTNIDIGRYLPDFVQQDTEFGGVLHVDNSEHEQIKQNLQDIFKQFFVETATWGLDGWERVLSITTDKGLSYAQRRNKILLKLQSHQTSTKTFMERLLARYFPTAQAPELQELNTQNKFRVLIKTNCYDYEGLIIAIKTYAPAHLAWVLARYTEVDQHLYSGGVICFYNKTKIKDARTFSGYDITANYYLGGIVKTLKVIKIRSAD